MRQDAGGARFAEQPLAQAGALLGIADFAQADGLDGHRTADGRVGGLIHDAHGAPPQFAHDLVASDAVHQTYSVLCREHAGEFRWTFLVLTGRSSWRTLQRAAANFSSP